MGDSRPAAVLERPGSRIPEAATQTLLSTPRVPSTSRSLRPLAYSTSSWNLPEPLSGASQSLNASRPAGSHGRQSVSSSHSLTSGRYYPRQGRGSCLAYLVQQRTIPRLALSWDMIHS